MMGRQEIGVSIMDRYKKAFLKAIFKRTLFVSAIFTYAMILAGTKSHQINYVTNVNGVKSLEAVHIISKYDNKNQTLSVLHVNNMEEAVRVAKKVTKKGTSCLLSPAASSYGFFKNFKDRGNLFKKLVLE